MCQTVWIQIRPDILSGLIWVQIVCTGYQQTTLVGHPSIDFFFSKKILSGIPSVSNSLDPDQAQHFVGPDLGPNCLQRLSADEINKKSANYSQPKA